MKGMEEDNDDSDLEGVDQVDWVESSNAKELLGTGLKDATVVLHWTKIVLTQSTQR